MARRVQRDVKSKGEVIGQAIYDEPASLQEAIDMFGGEKVLNGFNYYLSVNENRKVAQKAQGGSIPKEVLKKLRNNPEMLKKLEKLLEG